MRIKFASISRSIRGFTLIELLVVIAIISLLAVLILPAVRSVLTSSNLSSAGQILGDTIQLARQEAVAKNRNVEVLFYNLDTPLLKGWCGFQIVRLESTGSVNVTRVKFLPTGMIISPGSLSPLLTVDANIKGTTTLPGYGSASYVGFYYRPNGAPENFVTSGNNYLTLQNRTDTGNPPTNYYTLQINPITGKLIAFRP